MRAIAIDAMPYLAYKYASRNDAKQLDERRDCAAAGARTQAAVSTGAVRQSRGPAAGLAKQGDSRRSDFARWQGRGLAQRGVQATLAVDILAMKLCFERVLPRRQERPVTFSLPSLAAVGNGDIDEASPQNASRG